MRESLGAAVNRQQILQLASCDFIRQHRNVLICGPTGTGKTRLAMQVAATLLDQFVDGVYFVSLAPIRDAALVIPVIA